MSQYIGNIPDSAKQQVITVDQRRAGKNYIINPTFSINQRGFAGGVTPAGNYTFDRWKGIAGVTSISLPDANGFVTISGGSDASAVNQPIEDFGYSGIMTLSWEGSAQVGAYRSNGNSWAALGSSPQTINIPTGLSGSVKEWIGFTNGTVKNVKLERDASPTLFEHPNTASELDKCQRYFERIDSAATLVFKRFGIGYAINTTESYAVVEYKVSKRVVPTVTISTLSLFGYHLLGSVRTPTGVTINISSKTNATMRVQYTAYGVSGDVGALIANNNTSAYIDADAEL